VENYGRANIAPAEGLLTVGDAAAFIDPFTGSGMLLALENSKVLSEAITSELSGANGTYSFTRLAGNYEDAYRAAFDGRLAVSSLVRLVAFVPFLAETVIKVLALSERLTRRLARATRPGRPLEQP
jgi:flavin-dependent dehydrogenase